MVAYECTNLVNFDVLRKVMYRICFPPAHYKCERINFCKYHPKHVEAEILPEGQQNRGNVCPEYIHRNKFLSIVVHIVKDTEHTFSEGSLRQRRVLKIYLHNQKSFLNISHEGNCILSEDPCFLKFTENTVLINEVTNEKDHIYF